MFGAAIIAAPAERLTTQGAQLTRVCHRVPYTFLKPDVKKIILTAIIEGIN